MRKMSIGAAILAVIMFAGMAVVAEEGAKWLDPANCHFCQPMAEQEGLLENLNWEHHNITNGMVSVTTYTADWEDKFKAASAAAGELWQTFDPAQEYNLCGMCQAWMVVPMDKVVYEVVEFAGGQIDLATTNDAEVLAQLHSITDRTNEEYKTMMTAEEELEGQGDE